MTNTKKFSLGIAGLVVALLGLSAFAETAETKQISNQMPEQQITSLDELLRSVKENQRKERAKNLERERKFLREKSRQQSLLKQARRNFEIAQKHNNPLKKITEANTDQIAALKKKLENRKQEMGDIYGTFSEMAGDFSAALQESMITVQVPERQKTLKALAKGDKLATIDDLESLWLLVQEEMTEQGKIARFDAPVVTVSGNVETQPILRVGSFTVFSEDSFLRYIPETGEYLELDRQPASRFGRDAKNFSDSSGEVQPMVVDPTGGSLLGVMAHTPTLRERVEQGGVIGMIIICLGVLGLLITLWRVGYLGRVYLAIHHQLTRIDQPDSNNPLGRVLLSAKESLSGPDRDGEVMQYKLDEAILAEMPALERSHNLIKLLAATSPLLGLLGTVTGMILTFQAISLFGSGDPKLMAAGISQALITTVLGLIVAIPLLFGYSLVSALSGSMIQRLDEQSAGMMAKIVEGQQTGQQRDQHRGGS